MWAYLTRGDGIDELERVDRPDPTPGPGQVRVRMSAVGLNYRDLLVVGGVATWKPTGPRVPVSDGVGVVDAVGPGVARVAVGDRVAGTFLPRWIDGDLTEAAYAAPLGGATTDGVLAQYRVFDEQAVVRVPEHLSDAEAATLPVAALTAWHALRFRSRVEPGDSVLVQGTGGVALFALQFAVALGARTFVSSSDDEKLERARALGAAETINYRKSPRWADVVLARTDGRGVDHVVEVVGGANLNESLRAVRISGTIAFIGLLAGMEAPIDTWQFVARNVTIHGIETGSRAMFEDMNRFLAEHGIRPVLDAVVPLADVRAALRRVESGKHFGKVAIDLVGAPGS